MAAMQLLRIGPEPWGARLYRARKRTGLEVRQVEEILFPHISKSSLIRLERIQEMPTGRKDRSRAALVLTLYGYELDDFGLSQADLPPAMDMKVLERMRRSSTKWYLQPSNATLAVAA
jgi:hypothetical protein